MPSWANNYHSDFWLGMCPWSQKMGDSSADIMYKCKVASWEKFQCEVFNK